MRVLKLSRPSPERTFLCVFIEFVGSHLTLARLAGVPGEATLGHFIVAIPVQHICYLVRLRNTWMGQAAKAFGVHSTGDWAQHKDPGSHASFGRPTNPGLQLLQRSPEDRVCPPPPLQVESSSL